MNFLENKEQITPDFIKDYISAYIPVHARTADVLNAGCENFAIDFGDVIVRLPKDEETLLSLKFEATVCKHIDVATLQTPKTKVVETTYPFSWHEKIPGDYFLTKNYKSLNDDQRSRVASQLAEFMLAFHILPIEKMRTLNARNLKAYIPFLHMRENAHIIPDDLKNHYGYFMQVYEALSVPETDIVFGHFDVHSWNMAFNQDTNTLIGVYDFADASIGDVHQEFHPLNTISQDLVKRVINKYEALSGRQISISKVNFYTVLAEYSELFETARGCHTLMDKGIDHHVEQIKRWEEELLF